jgi:hypothetical protein
MSAAIETSIQDFQFDELTSLTNQAGQQVLSILLPTHRTSPEYQQDQIRLKNLLGRAREMFGSEADAAPFCTPASRLLDDEQFWRHQWDGLAIFATSDATRIYRLPFTVPEKVYLDERPCLRPLLPRVGRVNRVRVLTVTWERANLYDLDQRSIRAANTDSFPTTFEDVVTARDPETQLQFRNQPRSGGAIGAAESAMYHGHGEGEQKIRADRVKYLTVIGDRARELLYNEDSKLVVVATEEVLGHLKSTTGVMPEAAVHASPAELTDPEVHQRVTAVIDEQERQEAEELYERVGNAVSAGKGSANMTEIANAARQSRIETLLVCNDQELWGQLDGAAIRFVPDSENGSIELVNAAVVETLKSSGSAFSGDAERLSIQTDLAAAVFRY